MKLHIENGTSYINEDGIALVEDNITKEVAELPAKGIDKNGALVYLVYKADGNDLIVEYHLMIQSRGFWKCTLGTVGAAGNRRFSRYGNWCCCRNTCYSTGRWCFRRSFRWNGRGIRFLFLKERRAEFERIAFIEKIYSRLFSDGIISRYII